MDIIKEAARLVELMQRIVNLNLYDFENANWCLEEFARLGNLTENSYSTEGYDKIKTYFAAEEEKNLQKKYENWKEGRDILYENVELLMDSPPFFT